jgi:hypothetical protein
MSLRRIDFRTRRQQKTGGPQFFMSQYKTIRGKRLWIITQPFGENPGEKATTLMLPSEY